jgi:hypothetical protein
MTAPGGRRKEEAVSSRHHRALRLLVLIIASTALVAPMTAAAAGGSGVGVWSSPEVYTDPAVVAHKALGLLGRQNAALRTEISHGRTVESPAPVVVRVDGGFDWVSAGVGVAGGIGLAIAVVGATSTMRRRPRGDEARA